MDLFSHRAKGDAVQGVTHTPHLGNLGSPLQRRRLQRFKRDWMLAAEKHLHFLHSNSRVLALAVSHLHWLNRNHPRHCLELMQHVGGEQRHGGTAPLSATQS
jgi:hypothetical protein